MYQFWWVVKGSHCKSCTFEAQTKKKHYTMARQSRCVLSCTGHFWCVVPCSRTAIVSKREHYRNRFVVLPCWSRCWTHRTCTSQDSICSVNRPPVYVYAEAGGKSSPIWRKLITSSSRSFSFNWKSSRFFNLWLNENTIFAKFARVVWKSDRGLETIPIC